jgi:hypothetical protein
LGPTFGFFKEFGGMFHIDASLLAMSVLLAQNITKKSDELVMYVSRLLNNVEHNIKKKTLAMVFALHKFRHYLLGNKFVFYLNHMALVYLVNKPQVSQRLIRWLLLFLEYDFIVIYKLNKTHVVIDVLSKLLNVTKSSRILEHTTYVSLFLIELEWLNDVNMF